jgi:hypothetical protein
MQAAAGKVSKRWGYDGGGVGEVVGGYGMHQPQHMQQVVGSCQAQVGSNSGNPCQEMELKAAIDLANHKCDNCQPV